MCLLRVPLRAFSARDCVRVRAMGVLLGGRCSPMVHRPTIYSPTQKLGNLKFRENIFCKSIVRKILDFCSLFLSWSCSFSSEWTFLWRYDYDFKASTQLATSSSQVKVSLLIPDFYWPGKICQFSTSTFFQTISPMTSVRMPNSLEIGESES